MAWRLQPGTPLRLRDGRSSALSSRHHVRGHFRNGRWVRPHWARNPGRKSHSASPSRPANPVRPPTPPSLRRLSKPARVTVVVTISLAATVGGISASLKISSSSGASGHSAASGTQPLSTDVTPEDVEVNLKQSAALLGASGFNGTFVVAGFDHNCAAHAYGAVQSFLRSHPCKWLARAYFAVRYQKQSLLLIATSWVDMPDPSLARKYKRLVDGSGTGNITELSRDSGPYRNVIYTGKHYASGISGASVWNVQVQPIDPVSPDVLKIALNDSRQ